MSAKSEINKLAKFFATEMSGEIEKGTPVDNAIRLLRRQKSNKADEADPKYERPYNFAGGDRFTEKDDGATY